MNKTLEGMARAICLAIWDHDYTPRDSLHHDARWLQAMDAAKACAEFLADFFAEPVSAAEFETSEKIKALKAAIKAYDNAIVSNRYEQMSCAISAALRAAAGSSGEAAQ